MVAISILIGIVLLLVGSLSACIWLRRRFRISFAVLGLGMLTFMVSTQFFERFLHVLVLRPDATGSSYLLRDFPLLYVLYAVAAAALFEELARFFLLKILQKRRPLVLSDSLAYGLGHGLMEMLVVGLLSLVNLYILYQALEANPAQLSQLLPAETISAIQSTQAWTIYVLVLERFLALLGQVVLTFWVYQAVVQAKPRFLVAALALHALLDLAPALSQVGWISSPLLVEALVFLALFVLLYLTRRQFFSGRRLQGK